MLPLRLYLLIAGNTIFPRQARSQGSVSDTRVVGRPGGVTRTRPLESQNLSPK